MGRGEEWSQMARGGRRGGRASGRAGGGSKLSMADWIDANLPATRFAKLAHLAQTHKATAVAAAIVRKFQEQATPPLPSPALSPGGGQCNGAEGGIAEGLVGSWILSCVAVRKRASEPDHCARHSRSRQEA